MKQAFAKIPDPLAGRTNYSLADCFMAGLAMFGLKYRSLLPFKVKHNLATLYGVERVPCDTYMRERLDPIDPKRMQRAF